MILLEQRTHTSLRCRESGPIVVRAPAFPDVPSFPLSSCSIVSPSPPRISFHRLPAFLQGQASTPPRAVVPCVRSQRGDGSARAAGGDLQPRKCCRCRTHSDESEREERRESMHRVHGFDSDAQNTSLNGSVLRVTFFIDLVLNFPLFD